MRSRMERYDSQIATKNESRTSKNRDLYENFYGNPKIADLTSVEDKNVVELDSIGKSYQTRESYHRVKEYQDLISPPVKRQRPDDLSLLFKEEDNKVYDINSVLEEAKRNRQKIDELEKRRKLKNTQYNILANLDLKALEDYKNTKHDGDGEEDLIDDETLEKLIHTLTSKRLTKEELKETINDADNKDLLSDLMPTTLDETIISESVSKDILDKTNVPQESVIIKKDVNEPNEMDTSFYTRSMDLSEEDFEMDDEFDEDVNNSHALFLKILAFVVAVIIVTVLIFFAVSQIS